MAASLHNLDDQLDEPPAWEYYADLDDIDDDIDPILLERHENELDQINRWIDVAEQHDAGEPDQSE